MSQTITNLTQAYLGEDSVNTKYLTFAKIADREGHKGIAKLLRATAKEEREHRSEFLEMLKMVCKRERVPFATPVQPEAKTAKFNTREGIPIVIHFNRPEKIGNTIENLINGIKGEHYQHSCQYIEWANQAERDNYIALTPHIIEIARDESRHEVRFKKMLDVLTRK